MSQETQASSHIGYVESKDKLAIRIKANKEYTNFSLEDWLEENLPFKEGEMILDIGCGNGNLFECYARKLKASGNITGIDQSDELLNEAQKRTLETPFKVLKADMNEGLPFEKNAFHHVISTFAVYYVQEVAKLVDEIWRVVKPEGLVLLIGPTIDNAKELYEFNERIFGIPMDSRITKRSERIEREFSPLMTQLFRSVEIEKIPIKMIFPSREEFIKYYLATLLYEESKEKTGRRPKMEEFSIEEDKPQISKEIVVLRGQK